MAISTKTTENIALLAELPWYIKKLLPSSLRHALDNNKSQASERNVCAIYCAWLNNRWYLDIVFRLFNIYDQFYSNDVIKSLTALEKYGELTEKNSRIIDKASFEAIIGLDEPLQHIKEYTQLLDSLKVNQPLDESFRDIRPFFIPTPGGQVNEQVKHVLNKFKEHNLLSERQGQTNLKRLAPILLNLENFFEREDFWALFKEQETAQTNFELLVFCMSDPTSKELWLEAFEKPNGIRQISLVSRLAHNLLTENKSYTDRVKLIDFLINISDLLENSECYSLIFNHPFLDDLISLNNLLRILPLDKHDDVHMNNFKKIAKADNPDRVAIFLNAFLDLFQTSDNPQQLFDNVMANTWLFYASKHLSLVPPHLFNVDLIAELFDITTALNELIQLVPLNKEDEEALEDVFQFRIFRFVVAYTVFHEPPNNDNRPNQDVIVLNNAQSTHTASVHQTVSESAKILWNRYKDRIIDDNHVKNTLTELTYWVNNLFQRPEQYEQRPIYLATLDQNPVNLTQDDLKILLNNNYYGYVLCDTSFYFIDLANTEHPVKHAYFKKDANYYSLFPEVGTIRLATKNELNNIASWIDFAPSAKAFFKRMATNNFCSGYTDPASQVSLQVLLALVWMAINDTDTLRCPFDTVTEYVVEGYYETQRGYNLNEQAIDDGESDKPICTEGTFNKQIEKLNGIHPLVNLAIITKESLGLKIPVVINKAVRKYVKTMSDDPNDSSLHILTTLREHQCAESIWELIQKEIKDSLFDEYGSLFPNEVEFNEYIDAGGKDVDFNEKTIEKLDEAIASLSDNANNVSLSA